MFKIPDITQNKSLVLLDAQNSAYPATNPYQDLILQGFSEFGVPKLPTPESDRKSLLNVVCSDFYLIILKRFLF
jgi:hypothetical protein